MKKHERTAIAGKRWSMGRAIFASLLASLPFIALLGGVQSAQAAPFTCSNQFFQVINGTIKVLNPTDGTYANVGLTGSTGSLITNAIGYNSVDNYIYGWQQPSFGGTLGLVKIEDDATTTPLGIPAGIPTPASYVAGDFDTSGYLYMIRGGTNELYKINVSAMTSTLITLDSAPNLNEIVYVGGLFYSVAGTNLYIIDPIGATVTTKALAITPDLDNPSSVYGAGWASDTSRLYFSRNSDGKIFEITNYSGASPMATPVLNGQTASGNDGASCILAQTPIVSLLATNDVGSTKKNTVLRVLAAQGLLTNDTGQQITVTSYTQPSHGTVTVNPDGSYTYTPTTDYAGADTFTYIITDEFGTTSTATVTLMVTDDVLIPALADTGSSQFIVLAVGLTVLSAALYWLRILRKQML